MSRPSLAKAGPRRVNAATLVSLGPERLAELLATASKTDPALKRTLALEVAIGPENLGEEIDRQIFRIRTSKGRLTAARATKLAREITLLLEVVGEKLGGLDAVAATLRLFDLLSLGPPLLGRRTGEGGPLLEALLSISPRVALLTGGMTEADQKRVVDPLYRAYLADPQGVAAKLPADVAGALKPDARRVLREGVEADLAALNGSAPNGAAQEAVRLTSVLGQIADADGDVDAFLAAQERRVPQLRDHVGSAQRLLGVGRVAEAAALMDLAPPGAVASSVAFAELRIDVMERSGAVAAAQTARWRLFQTTLSADVLRQHLRRMPDFEDVEREEDALAHAQAFTDATVGLQFLTTWPSLRRAAALVRARSARLDGLALDVLGPAAGALAHKDPLAATLVLRAMIEAALQTGGRRELARAGLSLAECEALAQTITDWEGRTDQATYVVQLRRRQSRKAAFWKAFTAAWVN